MCNHIVHNVRWLILSMNWNQQKINTKNYSVAFLQKKKKRLIGSEIKETNLMEMSWN